MGPLGVVLGRLGVVLEPPCVTFGVSWSVLATLEGHSAFLGVVLATLEGFWKDSGGSLASFQVDLGDPKPVQKRSQNKV